MTAERRHAIRTVPRTPSRRHAWIACGGSSALIPCVISDISDKGARITAAHLSLVPDYFALILSRDGDEYRPCRVVWREGGFAGVSFMSRDDATRSDQATPDVSPFY